jgi:hypothetical protein
MLLLQTKKRIYGARESKRERNRAAMRKDL